MSLLNQLFQRRRKKDQKQAAKTEISAVSLKLSSVYDRNSSAFFDARADASKLMFDVLSGRPSRDVIGIFLLGVVVEIISGMPELPTGPYERAYIHLMGFLTDEQTPFAEAQDRTMTVKKQVESLDKYTAHLVALGREAANDDENADYLLKCYDAAERYRLLGL